MRQKQRERLARIRALLEESEKISVVDLAETLHVSNETIRHDLDHLEEERIVLREHGAVRLNRQMKEMPITYRENESIEAKRRLAIRAFQEIKDGMIVFLDSGSTVLSGIEALRSRKNLMIVTNSVPVALEASKMKHDVLLVGGLIRNSSLRTIGDFTNEMIDHVQLDLVITSTAGILNASGFTTNSFQEVGFRRHLLNQTRKLIVICDREKFRQRATYMDLRFKEVDMLITNTLTEKERAQVKDIPIILEI